MSFLHQGNTIPRTHSRCGRDQTSPSQDRSHEGYAPTIESKTGLRLPWTSGILPKIHQELCEIAKLLTMLTRMDVKFEWKETHHCTFMKLKDAIIQAPILRYPDTTKPYIVYTDASDDACRTQLSQIHNETKFPVAFLSHMFTDTQRRWSTPEQEAYGIYFAIKKWNYYLQGADIIVRNDHKPLARFLNGKNENTKINRWGLELASYNITFEWISGAKNKAADCLM